MAIILQNVTLAWRELWIIWQNEFRRFWLYAKMTVQMTCHERCVARSFDFSQKTMASTCSGSMTSSKSTVSWSRTSMSSVAGSRLSAATRRNISMAIFQMLKVFKCSYVVKCCLWICSSSGFWCFDLLSCWFAQWLVSLALTKSFAHGSRVTLICDAFLH